MEPERLVRDLENIPLSYSSIREIIQVVHRNKIARLSLRDSQLVRASKIFDALELSYFLSDRKYLSLEDRGKGGFSNSFSGTVDVDVPIGDFLVYIGRDQKRVAEAKFAEASGNNALLGQYFGYPECCIRAFATAEIEAASLQNDFTLPILKNSTLQVSSDPLSIHLPQYFGYGLFSHFPCSTNCSYTSSISLEALYILTQIDERLADRFRRYQFASYLYTEFDGIYVFFDATYSKNDLWFYDSRQIEMSTSGLLAENLTRGNQIAVTSPSSFTILRDGTAITSVESENVYLFLQ